MTTGSNVYTTPPLTYQPNRNGKKATTFTYFCRIHPLMRGSIRVRKSADRREPRGDDGARTRPLGAHPATANRSHSPGAPLRV